MKRQDVSGQNTLHTDGSGGAGTSVDIASVGGTPVTSPLPVSATLAAGSHVITDTGSTTVVTGNVTVVQPTGTNLHAVLDATSTTTVTQATGTNLHVVVDSGATTVSGTVTTKELRAATSALTNVAASATNVTVLASNANRLAATIDNDSTVNLYAKFGTTASTSSFTVKIPAGAYYEVPGGYTGIIDGLWDSATGNARVTELTA